MVLGGPPSNGAVVNLLYNSLLGVAPSQQDYDFFVAELDSGVISQAALAMAAANLQLNLYNIDLVGLERNGLPFIEVA